MFLEMQRGTKRSTDVDFLCPQTSSKAGFPEVKIAVVGEENAGKSSFIRRALDTKNSPSSTSKIKKMSLDGSVYMVEMLEIDLKEVRIDKDHQVMWPRRKNGALPPAIDGVLALHDATDPERLPQMTGLLGVSQFEDVFSWHPLTKSIQTR